MKYEVCEIEKNIKKKQKRKRIIVILIYIIIIPIILFDMFFIVQTIFLSDNNIQQYSIISGSMSPAINVNDLIVVSKCSKDELKEQDIITYTINDDTITHRIIKIEDSGGEKKFFTKGDSNAVVDDYALTYNMINGRVIFKIPFVGKLFVVLRNTNIFFMILTILFAFYLYERRMNKKKLLRRLERQKYEKERNM